MRFSSILRRAMGSSVGKWFRCRMLWR